MSVTKADLIAVVADKLKFPWARAELLVDTVFGCLDQSMSRGEKIEIRGFGTFPKSIPRNAIGRPPFQEIASSLLDERAGLSCPTQLRTRTFWSCAGAWRGRNRETT